jgi:hypothetical protein
MAGIGHLFNVESQFLKPKLFVNCPSKLLELPSGPSQAQTSNGELRHSTLHWQSFNDINEHHDGNGAYFFSGIAGDVESSQMVSHCSCCFIDSFQNRQIGGKIDTLLNIDFDCCCLLGMVAIARRIALCMACGVTVDIEDIFIFYKLRKEFWHGTHGKTNFLDCSLTIKCEKYILAL